MKRTSFVIPLLFLAIVFALPASASATAKPGVKPGNFFYFFDTAFERVNLFFTFSPEKKVKKALEHADERLAEIEAIAEEKNPDAIKTAITNYESNVALATEKSKEVQDKGRAESLLTSITDNTSKHQEILSDVLSRVPDEAKEAITKAMEASRKGQEEASRQIAELKGEVEQLKKEVAELKQKEEPQTNQNNQSAEIEKLKKEVEELEKKSAPVVSVPKPSVPPAVSNNAQLQAKAQSQNPMSPTAEQLTNVRRFCLSDTFIKSVCDDPNFMSGYYSNEKFRLAIDNLIKKYYVILSANEQQKNAAEKAKLDCIMAPTPEDERVFDPATQNYLRQVRCGTVTDADRTNYELSRMKSSVDELKYRLDSKISFPSFYLDPIKAPTFSTPRWQIRWEGSGGTITDSAGIFYHFRCEYNTCRSY